MRISRSSALPQEAKADLLIVGIFEGQEAAPPIAKLDALLGGHLRVHVTEEEFEAKEGVQLAIHTHGKLPQRKLALLGLGDRKRFNLRALRSIAARAAKMAAASKAASLALWLPIEKAGAKTPEAIQAVVEGLLLGSYRYERYKDEKKTKRLEEVTLLNVTGISNAAFEKSLADAVAFAGASSYARDLVNTPALDMHPATFVQEALTLAVGQKRMSIKVFGRAELQKMGCGGILAVAQGSVHEPKMVHLAYKPPNAKKRIVLVGKGVTFDSGGLSIKPADAMMDMKIDMAGAAAVLAVFRALATLQLPVEVHGIAAMVENMPGGNAYRPGDIVKTMSGKTIEVLNTDAEGRVTLADSLFYGSKLKPDMMIDLATLTGACIVAVGQDIAGLLTDDDRIAARLEQASASSGEPIWRLPLYAPYADQVKSRHADLKNIGSKGGAGTTTAALFLKEFVGETPWAHLDIAGPAYNEKDYQDERSWGASGYGARLMLEFLRRL
jgi:leucyl aminopeptidase